jgi:hypothetical protein
MLPRYFPSNVDGEVRFGRQRIAGNVAEAVGTTPTPNPLWAVHGIRTAGLTLHSIILSRATPGLHVVRILIRWESPSALTPAANIAL